MIKMKYPSELGGHLKKKTKKRGKKRINSKDGTKEGMCNVAGKLQ